MTCRRRVYKRRHAIKCFCTVKSAKPVENCCGFYHFCGFVTDDVLLSGTRDRVLVTLTCGRLSNGEGRPYRFLLYVGLIFLGLLIIIILSSRDKSSSSIRLGHPNHLPLSASHSSLGKYKIPCQGWCFLSWLFLKPILILFNAMYLRSLTLHGQIAANSEFP